MNSSLLEEAASQFAPDQLGRDSAPWKRTSLLKRQSLLPPSQLPFGLISSLAELGNELGNRVETALHSPFLCLNMSL